MDCENLKRRVESACDKILVDNNWDNFRDLRVELVPNPLTAGAHITLDERRINLMIPEGWDAAIKDVIKLEKFSIEPDEYMDLALNFLVKHEYGHHRYCPRTRENFEDILQGCFDAIQGREVRKETIQQMCLYLHNMFSDTVLNTINAHKPNEYQQQRFRQGFELEFLLMYHQFKQMRNQLPKKQRGKRRPDKGFTLFYNAQHHLLQTEPALNERMQKYLARTFPGYPKYRKRVLDVFTGQDELTEQLTNMSLADSTYLVRRLETETLWKDMAYEYATIVYPFIRQEQRSVSSAQDTRSRDEKAKPNKRKQAGDKKKEEKKGSGKDKQADSNSGNDKKDEDKGRGRMSDIMDKLMGDSNRKPHTSKFLAEYRRLDRLYKERAGRLNLIGEENKISNDLELYTSVEEMPLEEFIPSNIAWSDTRIIDTPNGTQILLARRANPIILPAACDWSSGGIPDLAFILDSSISMRFAPFEGDGEGQYHTAVLAFYSILNFLEQEGLAPLMNFNMINFSHSTYWSGWKPYDEIDYVKKTLFDYQGYCTLLDPAALKDLRQNRQSNCLVFMLSDMMLNSKVNEEAVIQEFGKMLDGGGIGLFAFALGPKTELSKELSKMGGTVMYIEDADDFRDKTIQISKALYSEVIEK